jgi:hypothetical protein
VVPSLLPLALNATNGAALERLEPAVHQASTVRLPALGS